VITRSDFLLRSDITFLNHGSFGACPIELLSEQRRWIERLESQPVLYFRELMHEMRSARQSLAAYIGAKAENIAFVTNSTYGVNVAAHAVAEVLQPGDEILSNDHEYGACNRAWRAHAVSKGAVYVQPHIPIPVPRSEDLVEIIWSNVTERTKVLFISHITSPTAVRLPVEELCARARELGIITIVDGSHSPGHIPLDLAALGCDIYTANCHKWMCTPKGSAFLWVSDAWINRMKPLVVSWGSDIPTVGDGYFIDEHEFLGTRDHSPFLTIPYALKWMERNDWPALQQQCRSLTKIGVEQLCRIEGVAPIGLGGHDPMLQMGTVILPSSTSTDEMKTWLYDERNIEVVVHRWLETPLLRFSVHAHTTQEDIQRLYGCVREYLNP
jgi:isopenicillin-N epimerase